MIVHRPGGEVVSFAAVCAIVQSRQAWAQYTVGQWPGGEVVNTAVCKTAMRGFNSHPGLLPLPG